MPILMVVLFVSVRTLTYAAVSPASRSKESRFVVEYAGQKGRRDIPRLTGLSFQGLQQKLSKKDPFLGVVVDVHVLPTRADQLMEQWDIGLDLCFSAFYANIPLALHVLHVWSNSPDLSTLAKVAETVGLPIMIAIVQIFFLFFVMFFSSTARVLDANRRPYLIAGEILIGVLSLILAGIFMAPLLKL